MDKMRISLRHHKQLCKDGEWHKIEGLGDQDYNTLEAMAMTIEALGDLECSKVLTVWQHNVAVAKMASDYFAFISRHLDKVE